MKKIVFLDQYAERGGGQTVLLQALKALEGQKLTVIAPGGGSLEKAVHGLGVEFIPVKVGQSKIGAVAGFSLAAAKNLKVIAEADAVYINGPRWVPALLMVPLRIKHLLIHLHLDYSSTEKSLIQTLVHKSQSSHLIAISEYIRSQYWNAGIQTVLVSNCVSEEFLNSQTLIQPRYENRQQVAVLGRVIPEKGQNWVVEAAYELQNYQFHILGGPDFGNSQYYEDLKAKAPQNVHFYGTVNSVLEKLEELKCGTFVVPSIWQEPFGLTALEGVATQHFVLCTKNGGLKEISEFLELNTFNSKMGLVSALESLALMSEDAFNASVKSSFDKLTKKYSPKNFAKAIRQLFNL